jgi:hypothetical protein
MYRVVCAAIIASLVTPAFAGEGRWSFSTGADYTTGDYGEAQDTTIVIVPFSVGYKEERWGARLTVPYVTIEGPGTIVPGSSGSGAGGGGGIGGLVGGLLDGLLGGGGGAEAPAPAATNVNESGLGDITFALSVVPFMTEAGTRLTLTGRVRAPTSDAERALGIDDTALALTGTLAHSFAGRSAIYGSLGYEHAFESQADALFAQLGGEAYVMPRVLVGSSLDWAQANSTLRRDSTQASLYAGYEPTSEVRILAYASAGLTETSPDIGAGLRVIYSPQ